MYEFFPKTHWCLAVAFLVLMWIHIGRITSTEGILIAVAYALMILQWALWIGQSLYRNRGVRGGRMKITTANSQSITRLSIELDRSWKYRPGQYIYLTVLGNMLHDFSVTQSHPYMIAWADDRRISLLVERRSGFSSSLYAASDNPIPVFVDGPYGGHDSADDYDKILCLASGVGSRHTF